MPTLRHIRGRLRLLTAMVGCYWLLLFVATHIPLSNLKPGKINDKLLHFGAYAALAWLLAWAVSQRMELRVKHLLVLWSFVCLYGVLDELLQKIPMINRNCDLYDWLADVAGATVSLLLFFLLTSILQAVRRTQDVSKNAG